MARVPPSSSISLSRRVKHYELTKLLSPPTTLKSLKYRRSTPGSTTTSSHPVNPRHPAFTDADKNHRRRIPPLPIFHSAAFKLRVIPHGLLAIPESPHPFPRHDDYGKVKRRVKPFTRASLQFSFSLPPLPTLAVHRFRIKAKIKEALSLIVTRGAQVDSERKIVFVHADIGEMWLLKDWTYCFHPSLEVYRMPMNDLIQAIRQALEHVATQGKHLIMKWNRSVKSLDEVNPKKS